MIAERRARRRPLIRTTSMTAILAKNLTAVGGLVKRGQGVKNQGYTGRNDDKEGSPKGSGNTAGISTVTHYSVPQSFSDSMLYLQQLAILHGAGVLTDEEYEAAQRRLLGS